MLRNNGIFIAVTCSEFFHKNNWFSISNDIHKNSNLKSRQMYSVKLLRAKITFHDFFYSDLDYSNAFHEVGMTKIKTYHPLGLASDNVEWKKEWDTPPYTVYVCSVSK